VLRYSEQARGAGPLSAQYRQEARERERAGWAAVNMRSRLQQLGRESCTEYGRVLFTRYAEQVTIALGLLLEELVVNPTKPGPHFAAWPLLLHVTKRGPRSLAALSLDVVIGRIQQRLGEKTIARKIGVCLQGELRAGKVEEKSAELVALIRKRSSVRVFNTSQILKDLDLNCSSWTIADRQEVGHLMLELIVGNTDLLRRTRSGLEPTEATLELIKANPPRPTSTRRLPMLVPPRDWHGMIGGGHLDNILPLVRSQGGLDRSHLTPKTLSPVLGLVNGLQRQQLRVDPVMVGLQRAAWDCDLRGLFPVTRDPLTVPPKPLLQRGGGKEYRLWREACRKAHYDRTQHAFLRQSIDRSICMAEELAGLPLWFSYCLDFRGRVYTSNRLVTNQGPDWEKAAVNFTQSEPTPQPSGLDWMLKAAAGHFGIRDSWMARLDWAQAQIPAMRAVAAAPFDRLELWRDAKDPWQYLQLCQAISHQLDHPGAPSTVPIRFDQTCSGLGISAALMRDHRLAELTNVVGTTRQDIYTHLAGLLQEQLRLDLSNGNDYRQRHASTWLDFGINRSLCKMPVIAAMYGAGRGGFVDYFASELEEREAGRLPVQVWQTAYISPARYMANMMFRLLRQELRSCFVLQLWLRVVTKQVLSCKRVLRWCSPSGFPLRFDAAFDARTRVRTLTKGARRWKAWTDHAEVGERSARDTNRSITANTVHSFDAALCHGVIGRCLDGGVQLLTNHDCFAVTPAHAGWLHGMLHDELRRLYAMDWLTDVVGQVARHSGLGGLPAPPLVGTLDPAKIGNNPHCFC